MVYISHGTDEPRAWQKPVSKVYDANRISGEFYYRPMVEYLNWKDSYGAMDSSLLEERKEVILPSALELSKADQSCLGSGSPNVIAFLGKFYAKQISEVNTKKTWVKHGLARWSTDVNTIPYQRRTSEMIRDEYVLEVKNFFKSKERENMLKDHKYLNRKRDAKLLKYRYEVHPTASIALEFVLPNIVRGGFCKV